MEVWGEQDAGIVQAIRPGRCLLEQHRLDEHARLGLDLVQPTLEVDRVALKEHRPWRRLEHLVGHPDD